MLDMFKIMCLLGIGDCRYWLWFSISPNRQSNRKTLIAKCRNFRGNDGRVLSTGMVLTQRLGGALKELQDWLKTNNLSPSGVPFAFYYPEDSTSVSSGSASWAVCIPISAGSPVVEKSDVVIKKLEPMEVAVAIHNGGFDKIGLTYEKLENWIDAQGLEVVGPSLEFFISDSTTPVDSMRVKIGFVVAPISEEIEEDIELEDEESIPTDESG